MSAKSLREDAEKCLRLAEGISSPDVAKELRLMAAGYLEQAAKLEAEQLKPDKE